jgi:hypothetical protein
MTSLARFELTGGPYLALETLKILSPKPPEAGIGPTCGPI